MEIRKNKQKRKGNSCQITTEVIFFFKNILYNNQIDKLDEPKFKLNQFKMGKIEFFNQNEELEKTISDDNFIKEDYDNNIASTCSTKNLIKCEDCGEMENKSNFHKCYNCNQLKCINCFKKILNDSQIKLRLINFICQNCLNIEKKYRYVFQNFLFFVLYNFN